MPFPRRTFLRFKSHGHRWQVQIFILARRQQKRDVWLCKRNERILLQRCHHLERGNFEISRFNVILYGEENREHWSKNWKNTDNILGRRWPTRLCHHSECLYGCLQIKFLREDYEVEVTTLQQIRSHSVETHEVHEKGFDMWHNEEWMSSDEYLTKHPHHKLGKKKFVKSPIAHVPIWRIYQEV